MRLSENLENKILSNRYFLDQLIHLKFLQNHLWNATLIRFYSETKTSSESLYYCESLREYSFVVALKGNHTESDLRDQRKSFLKSFQQVTLLYQMQKTTTEDHQVKDEWTFFSTVTHFIITYHISLVNVQTNYCNNNLLILNVKQLNKIMKLLLLYFKIAVGWPG